MEDINQSCPTDLQPYVDAHRISEEIDDRHMWMNGMYTIEAYMATTGNMFRGKGEQLYKYPEHPKLQNTVNSINAEEEKQRQVDMFFAQEKMRRINWKINHMKDSTES